MKLEFKGRLANYRNFYDAKLNVRCEEKSGAIYWYGYDESKLKTRITRTSRGCGRVRRTVGEPWKRVSKKVAAEILAKYDITVEQFIAYTNEDAELMDELEAQRAEEEREELLDFFLSTPITSTAAQDIATEAEIELANKNSELVVSENTVVGGNNDADNFETAKKSEQELNSQAVKGGTQTATVASNSEEINSWKLIVTTRVNDKHRMSYYLNGRRTARKIIESEILKAFASGVVEVEIEESILRSAFAHCYNNYYFITGKARVKYIKREKILIQPELNLENQLPAAETKHEVNLPVGDVTVSSGAEAFALVAKYFPTGLEWDGIDYGYRGEIHFCFYNESVGFSVVAASDEENRRIEYLQVLNFHVDSRAKFEERCLLAVHIEAKKEVCESALETKSEPESLIKAKKVSAGKASKTDKAVKWLEGAKIDSTGKYYIVPELSYKGFEMNANWNPCFYIVTTDLKLRRVGLKFAVELAKLEQAIEISKENLSMLSK